MTLESHQKLSVFFISGNKVYFTIRKANEGEKQILILVPTCPKNRKNLRFPDAGILTTIAILRTSRFTLIQLLVVFTCNGVENMTEKFYHLKVVL